MSHARRRTAPARLSLAQALFSQGFGTRREVEALLAAGEVCLHGAVVREGGLELDPAGLVLGVSGQDWPYHERALVLLHKPAGYECSARPSAWPGVLTLLPPPLRRRGLQPVGRLDQDTTGVLLLTDDGALIHRLTSPRHHVPKTYEVSTARPVEPGQLQALREGVVLRDDPRPVRVAHVRQTGTHALQLVLTEGRYHQVRRMVAATGNHVQALHRSAFGPVTLPPGLAPGQWCWVDPGALETAGQPR